MRLQRQQCHTPVLADGPPASDRSHSPWQIQSLQAACWLRCRQMLCSLHSAILSFITLPLNRWSNEGENTVSAASMLEGIALVQCQRVRRLRKQASSKVHRPAGTHLSAHAAECALGRPCPQPTTSSNRHRQIAPICSRSAPRRRQAMPAPAASRRSTWLEGSSGPPITMEFQPNASTEEPAPVRLCMWTQRKARVIGCCMLVGKQLVPEIGRAPLSARQSRAAHLRHFLVHHARHIHCEK